MDIFAYTTLCAIGTNSKIIELEAFLPITNSDIDFSRIIPIPIEKNYNFETINKCELEDLKKWATEHWGTPHNGSIERLEKIYSYGSDSYSIDIRTVFNEPKQIIDEIVKRNPDLDYFIYNQDLFGNSYIGFLKKQHEEFLILSSHDNDSEIQLHEADIQKINLQQMHHLHWDFLEKNYLGAAIKKYLQNIPQNNIL